MVAIVFLTTENAIEVSEKVPSKASQDFRIVGFLYNWNNTDEIQFDKLTHINAYLYLKPDGSFYQVKLLEKLKNLVKDAHDNGVKVSISMSGGRIHVFEGLTADTNTRKVFVDKLVRAVNDYDLDGVDIDWEYPTNETSNNYLALLQELRNALPDKLVTSDVNAVADPDDDVSIPSEVFGIVDFLNIMAYDKNHADHSPYSYAEEAIDYWSSRGLNADKIVLGVPLYSQPDGIHYSELVKNIPAAANMDEVYFDGSKQYYNGIPTIQKKTKLALSRTGGIMLLELDYDTNDKFSILNAIFETVHD